MNQPEMIVDTKKEVIIQMVNKSIFKRFFDYLMSIPRPATSVATSMSFAPLFKLPKANSLQRGKERDTVRDGFS